MKLDPEEPKKRELKMVVKKKRKKRRKKRQKKNVVTAAVEFCPKCGCNLGAINKALSRAAK